MRFDDVTAIGGGGARLPQPAERPIVVHETLQRLRVKVPVLHTVELLDWATGGPRPAELAVDAAGTAP